MWRQVVNQVLLVFVTRGARCLKMNEVYCVRVKALKTSEAASILENIPKESTTRLPPVKPKAGEVFLYLNDDEFKNGTSRHVYA